VGSTFPCSATPVATFGATTAATFDVTTGVTIAATFDVTIDASAVASAISLRRSLRPTAESIRFESLLRYSSPSLSLHCVGDCFSLLRLYSTQRRYFETSQ
jgi:hypothetical protein